MRLCVCDECGTVVCVLHFDVVLSSLLLLFLTYFFGFGWLRLNRFCD